MREKNLWKGGPKELPRKRGDKAFEKGAPKRGKFRATWAEAL